MPSWCPYLYNGQILISTDLYYYGAVGSWEFMCKILKQPTRIFTLTSAWSNWSMGVCGVQNSRLYFGTQPRSNGLSISAEIPLNTWMHIVLSVNNSWHRIWINGNLMAEGLIPYHYHDSSVYYPAWLHGYNNSWAPSGVPGFANDAVLIDEFRGWKKELSAAEVNSLKQFKLYPPYPESLVDYFHFDEGVGSYVPQPVKGTPSTYNCVLVADEPYLRELSALSLDGGNLKYYDEIWKVV